MIRAALVGLGKMGISHLAIMNSHPGVQVAAVCDSTQYLLDVLERYGNFKCFSDYQRMLGEVELDCVVIATPTRLHAKMVELALERGLHVFCEKPFSLGHEEGARLAELAETRALVNQVGYHYRFVGAFREAKRILAAEALGKVHNIRAEAYGPVVLRARGSTWRSARQEGGGCLYDYASHAIDLLNYLVGPPKSVSGTILGKVFSRDVEDEVYSTFRYAGGASGQLLANWSDESLRRMYTRVSVWGSNGRINVDRQECQVYLRQPVGNYAAAGEGWNVRYTTDLTDPVWYYLRGEEYSAQVGHFVDCINDRAVPRISTFATALETDRVIDLMIEDSSAEAVRPDLRGGNRKQGLSKLFSRKQH